MADLFVKIDELADYATFFAKLAGDSEAASKGLVQGFAAFDNAWGGDAPGAAFFGAYAEPAADTLGCAQQVPVAHCPQHGHDRHGRGVPRHRAHQHRSGWRCYDRMITEIAGDGDSVTSLSRTVFANWSGNGADAASAQISQVSRFATSLAAATGVTSKGCTTGASYVTNTKNGINVVLIQLDNLTKGQILIGLADPLQIPICLIRIIELRKRARALISAYYDALTSAMGGIPFAVTIQPRPKRATTASTATSGTAQGSVGQGGTGGGSGTSSATSTSTASATGGSATGSHGDVAAPTDSNAWTGDLAGYQDIGNTAAVIGTVPAKTDASTDSSSGTTQDTTGTHGPKHTDSAPGTQPTSVDTSLTSAPTGTDSLGSAHDLDSTFTNATGQTPAGGTPGQGGPPPGGGPQHTDVRPARRSFRWRVLWPACLG